MTNRTASEETMTDEERLKVEKRREYWQQYYARNQERLSQQHKERRQADPEKHRASVRKYYAAHKDELIAASRKRRDQVQGETRDKAQRHFTTWTSEEDRKLLESPLTAVELAEKLGRTYASVTVRRGRLRREARAAAEQEQSANENGPASLEG